MEKLLVSLRLFIFWCWLGTCCCGSGVNELDTVNVSLNSRFARYSQRVTRWHNWAGIPSDRPAKKQSFWILEVNLMKFSQKKVPKVKKLAFGFSSSQCIKIVVLSCFIFHSYHWSFLNLYWILDIIWTDVETLSFRFWFVNLTRAVVVKRRFACKFEFRV